MSARAIPLYNPETYHGEYGPYIEANRHRHSDPDLGEHTHTPQHHDGATTPAWRCDHCPQPSSMAHIGGTPSGSGLYGCNKCGCVFGRDGLYMRARPCKALPA